MCHLGDSGMEGVIPVFGMSRHFCMHDDKTYMSSVVIISMNSVAPVDVGFG